ncbi:MAG TPA: hypothetical protein VLT59_09535, partial [Steroidobacteraceae bacterium]|nr:hypothetical protein [Steroidobacteraceae bacterium]
MAVDGTPSARDASFDSVLMETRLEHGSSMASHEPRLVRTEIRILRVAVGALLLLLVAFGVGWALW